MAMYRKTYAEINLDHLEFNLNSIRQFFPNEFICPMVKANAYGHGDVYIARCLEKLGIQHLGVCLIEEGLLLRNFGIKSQILVFRGFDREGARKIIQYQMIPVVSSWAHIEHLEAVAQQPVSVHVKFDTGMNRLGFPVKDAQKLIDYFWQNKKIRVQAILTHLSQGEDGFQDQGDTTEQLRKMNEVSEVFKSLNVGVHALNSAGILSAIKVRQEGRQQHPLAAKNWGLRPGLMLYGYNPVKSHFDWPLKPVLNLKSVINCFRQIQKGEGVSYNSTWRAERESLIAVVPIGYADGYHRILSNKAEALFLGERAPIIGNVCMDYLMLDVTDIAKKKNFDHNKEHEVILLGGPTESEEASTNMITAYELAQKGQTIPWEILTSVGERVPRTYIGQRAQALRHEVSGP